MKTRNTLQTTDDFKMSRNSKKGYKLQRTELLKQETLAMNLNFFPFI